MSLLKSDLKISAGLLKESAPENHLLAYITPRERDMLIQAGGVKTPTPSGIFAYPPEGQYGSSGTGSYDGGSTGMGGSGDRDTGSDYGQFDRAVSQTSNNTSTEPKKVNNNTFRTRGRITDSAGNTVESAGTAIANREIFDTHKEAISSVSKSSPQVGDLGFTNYTPSTEVTQEPVKKSIGDKIMDYVKGGGMIGAVIRTIGGKLGVAKENQYAGITGEDGYGEGDYISTQGDWATSKGFVDKAEDYYNLNLEEQQDIDKQMYDDGVRSQAFNDLYEGDISNVNNLTSTERDAVNSIIPQMAYEVGETESQESQAAKWYANLGGNSDSFNLTTAYAAAKTKVAETLQNKGAIGMLAVNQSPFYNWLKTNKIDKGIL